MGYASPEKNSFSHSSNFQSIRQKMRELPRMPLPNSSRTFQFYILWALKAALPTEMLGEEFGKPLRICHFPRHSFFALPMS
jgi:hypothetical protein